MARVVINNMGKHVNAGSLAATECLDPYPGQYTLIEAAADTVLSRGIRRSLSTSTTIRGPHAQESERVDSAVWSMLPEWMRSRTADNRENGDIRDDMIQETLLRLYERHGVAVIDDWTAHGWMSEYVPHYAEVSREAWHTCYAVMRDFGRVRADGLTHYFEHGSRSRVQESLSLDSLAQTPAEPCDESDTGADDSLGAIVDRLGTALTARQLDVINKRVRGESLSSTERTLLERARAKLARLGFVYIPRATNATRTVVVA